MNRWIVSLSCLLCAGTASSAPQLKQFSHGMTIVPQSAQPVVQVLLPDDLYQRVTRNDLGDVRVFDRNGTAVPYALCEAPRHEPASVETINLPVVELRSAVAAHKGERIDVETAGGTHIEVQQQNASGTSVSTQAHVIDATQIEVPLRALEFDWRTGDGSSEARVRIDASEDLDRWETVVGATTLLRAGAQDELRRERVEVPQRRYRYLRVARADAGQPIQIENVLAEQVTAGRPIEPIWFPATLDKTTDEGLLFDSDRRAPVQYARFNLPFENMTVRITLQSRREGRFPFVPVWTGEAYSLVTNGEYKTSEPAQFNATTDRKWLMQVQGDSTQIGLQLGYRPALLRFVAQGAGPFTLAFGSRQVESPAALRCNQLLSNVDPKQFAAMLGDAVLSPARVLGGEDALKPLPKKTPLRLIVLWGVLIVGVGVLVAMALSLLKKVRH